ncbi:hypothetical protein Pfo_008485 [Paulownia fortunei]|nr:hypothetical protein Pfo_008485 [Paulownia fortunei]
MVRPLPSVPLQKLHFLPAPVTFFIFLTAFFSVFSVVTFLCGSHDEEKKTVRFGGKINKAAVKKVQRSLSDKALLMAKMISWRKVQDRGGAEEFDDGDGAVWKKTIMKGEKCRPLEFSGRISYDSKGNLLPEYLSA